MDPFLTPAQVALKEQAAEVASQVAAPVAALIDETDTFPTDLARTFGELGLIQLCVPEQYGGPGGRVTEACLVREEIGKVSMAASMIASNNTVGGVLPLVLAGSEELKDKYLPALATGEHLTCVAITEPEAGSDVSNMRSRAVRDGDHYVINGSKCFITFGSVASFCTLLVRTGSEADGARGLSAFFVHTDWPGFNVGKNERKMGMHGIPNVEISLEDLRVPVANRLGKEGEGFKVIMEALNLNRPTVGAIALGAAQGATDYAAGYARERRQFGRPVIRFQAVQFKLADMYIELEAARSLIYRTARLLDEGAPDGERFSAMAKCFATDVAMRVTTEAVQVLGGYGYMKDHPLERVMRDTKITQILEGTNEIQRLVVMRHT